MIEELAIVTSLEQSGQVWVKRLNASACGGCMQQSSCGSASIAQMLPKREFLIDSPFDLTVGDQVNIALDETHFLFSSVLLYLLPLLLMLAGVIVGDLLLDPSIKGLLPPLALVFLLLAFAIIHCVQSQLLLQFCFKPQIVDKLAAG